jgi:hypothetical protein
MEFQSFVRPYSATLLTMIKIVLIAPFLSRRLTNRMFGGLGRDRLAFGRLSAALVMISGLELAGAIARPQPDIA